jgi:hypothetical protein
MRARQRFARIWILTLIAALGAVALFNRLVDPYALRDGPLFEGINTIKARPDRALSDIKLAQALRISPDALILGNSRADIGLDPAFPGLRALARRPYNMAIPGAGMPTITANLEALLAAGRRPRLVIVGLEFLDYLNAAPAPRRPPAPRTARDLDALHLQSLFTMAALGDSVSTLRAQHDPHAATIRSDGFNPLNDYTGIAAREGYGALFRQRALENVRRIRAHDWPADIRATNEHAALARLLELAREHGMRVELMTYPYHAHILGALRREGLIDEFVAWKLAMADTVARAAQQGANVRLWDFSLVGEQMAEAVPDAGDRRSVTRWYWEGGHFKSALGDLMLARVLAPAGAAPGIGYGRLMQPGESPADHTLAADIDTLLRDRPDIAHDIDAAFEALERPAGGR